MCVWESELLSSLAASGATLTLPAADESWSPSPGYLGHLVRLQDMLLSFGVPVMRRDTIWFQMFKSWSTNTRHLFWIWSITQQAKINRGKYITPHHGWISSSRGGGSISAKSQHPAHTKSNAVPRRPANHDWAPFHLIWAQSECMEQEFLEIWYFGKMSGTHFSNSRKKNSFKKSHPWAGLGPGRAGGRLVFCIYFVYLVYLWIYLDHFFEFFGPPSQFFFLFCF